MNLLDRVRIIKEQQAHIRGLKREINAVERDVKHLFKLIAENVDIEKHCIPLSETTLVRGQIVVINDNNNIIVGEIDDVLNPPLDGYEFFLHNNIAYKSKNAYVIIKNN